jgi:hypothetical protein
MDIKRMSETEIRAKIKQFQERENSLKDIIPDLSDSIAKKALQVQIGNYKKTIEMLRNELTVRCM